jgi:hypothetical protein
MFHQRCLVLSQHLEKLGVHIEADIWKHSNPYYGWMRNLDSAFAELKAIIPSGCAFVLADEAQWGASGAQLMANRRAIPFTERDGIYAGPPSSDSGAISELQCQRKAGARFLVIGWPAFWWIQYYSVWYQSVRDRYPCVLANERLIVFDLEHRP